MMQGMHMGLLVIILQLCHCVRDDAQSKKLALKEKTDKEIIQYNLELKVLIYLKRVAVLCVAYIPLILLSGVDTCD